MGVLLAPASNSVNMRTMEPYKWDVVIPATLDKGRYLNGSG